MRRGVPLLLKSGVCQRRRAVYHHEDAHCLLFKVALHIDLVASSVEVPIDVARIVAQLVGAIFGEFNAVTTTLRAMSSLACAIKGSARSNREGIKEPQGVRV